MIARPHLQKLVERTRPLPPLPAAFVFPVDRDSLQLALSGAFAGYLAPVLVGPEARIREAAMRAGLDISRLTLVGTVDEPRAATGEAIRLARQGVVHALVRGSLSLEHLLAPVADVGAGLRSARRLSHATFLDVPGLDRFLIVADAALNIAPNLAAKREILQNTIGFAQALGVATPRVALLAARSAVTPTLPSTSEAAALKSMASQDAFPFAFVEGPMTPDVALSSLSRTADSEVEGRADILFAPTMESATMVARTLVGLTGGLMAGLVLGARVPIIVPNAHEAIDARIAACVLARLVSAPAFMTTASVGLPGPAKAQDLAAA